MITVVLCTDRAGVLCRVCVLCVTFQKQLMDLVTAQVTVDVHLEAQFAEGAVESLGVPRGSRPPPQLHPGVIVGHRHHHGSVPLPSVLLQSSPLQHGV